MVNKVKLFLMSFLLYVISTVPIILYPVIFYYTKNVNEVDLWEAKTALTLLLITLISVFIILIISLRNFWYTVLTSQITLLVIMNFSILDKIVISIFVRFKYWHTLLLLIFILINIVLLFLFKKPAVLYIKKISLVICSVFIFLSLYNLIAVSNIVYKKISNTNGKLYTLNYINKFTENTNSNLPNVYFFIFDEYSSFDMIKKHYNYDNVILENFLIEKSFNISYTSKNTSDRTERVTSSLLNLEYVLTDHIAARKNSRIFNLFKEHGYVTYSVEPKIPETWLVGNSDYQFKTKVPTLNNLNLLILQQTALKVMIGFEIYMEKDDNLKAIDYIVSIIQNETKSNRFIFSHFLLPHAPFLFDENGKLQPKSRIYDENDPSIYLGQFKYTTKIMMELLTEIIENDPESIIILQSDHSERTMGLTATNDKIFRPIEDITPILNAVYYKGEDFKIEGLSGVNTLRKIISNVFNVKMDSIEDVMLITPVM